MSRPKPTILLDAGPNLGHKSDQILRASGIWSVYYLNQPFNLKNINILISYPGPKYKKTSFSNPGHAINLCKKLNTQFHCNDFSVVLLTQGVQIYPPNDVEQN